MLPTVIMQHGLIVSYQTAQKQYEDFFGRRKYTEKTRQAVLSVKLYLEVIPQIGSTFECKYLKGTVKSVHHKVGLPTFENSRIVKGGLVAFYKDFNITSYQTAKEWYVIELEDEKDRFDRYTNWEDLEKLADGQKAWINIQWIGEWAQVNSNFKFKLPR